MPTIVEALSSHLFAEQDLKVHVLLDGASVPDLLDQLEALHPDYLCLRAGALKPDLAEVAPYLVRLEPEAEFTRWVLAQGWGKHWGIFALAAPNLIEMRHHFRTLTMVYDPGGKLVLFRFYDPRVLRIYLPTCNEHELKTMFGPVAAYLLEDEDPATLLRFEISAGRLGQQRKPLAVKEG